MATRTRKLDIAFLVLWAAILLASPAFKVSARLFGWPDFNKRAIVENRILAQFPNFKATPLRKWGRAFDDWYDDNFAWRADILRLHKAFRFQVAMCPIMGQVPLLGGCRAGEGAGSSRIRAVDDKEQAWGVIAPPT